MELYWCLLLIITFNTIFGLLNRSRQVRFVLICLSFFIMVVLSAIRKDIGVDYFGHYLIFCEIANGSRMINEPAALYLLLNKAAILFGLGFEFVVAAMSMITLAPIYYISIKEDNPLFIYFYFLVLYFISFALIRQCGGITFALLGTYFYVKENNLKKGLLFVVIGCLFHVSLCAYIPILILSRYFKLDFKYVLAISFLLIFSILFLKDFLFRVVSYFLQGSYYLHYIEEINNRHNVERSFNSGLGLIARHVFYISVLVLGNLILKEESRKSVLNFNYLFLIFFDLLSLQSRIFLRAAMIFYVTLFVPFFSKLKIKGSKQFVLCICMLVIYIFSYLILIAYSRNIILWENLPYKTIFFVNIRSLVC